MRLLPLICVLALTMVAAPAMAQKSKVDPKLKHQLKKIEEEAGDNVEGIYEAGRWAQNKGLDKDAERLFEKVLEMQPDHEGAHLGLGHIEFEGEWMSVQDAHKRILENLGKELKAKGWVKVGDTWVEPEHVDDAKKGIYWHDGLRVSRADKIAFSAGNVRHPRTGEFISATDLPKAQEGLYPMQNGEWVSEAEADKYHSDEASPWLYRSDRATLVSNRPIAEIIDLAPACDAGIEVASQIFDGRQNDPDFRPVVFFTISDDQYRNIGNAGRIDENGKARPLGDGESSYASFPALDSCMFPGTPFCRPVFCNYNANWMQYWPRHAAALAYVHCLIDELYGLANEKGTKDIPLWFRRGVAAYGERFLGEEVRTFFAQRFIQNVGFQDLKDWFKDYKIEGGMDWDRIDNECFQGALLFAYAMDPKAAPGNEPAAAALAEINIALNAGNAKAFKRAVQEFEQALLKAQKEIRDYLKEMAQG